MPMYREWMVNAGLWLRKSEDFHVQRCAQIALEYWMCEQ